MEELQIPERLEAIEERGYILEITPHNQLDNGYSDAVESGDINLITYTATIYNVSIERNYGAASKDTFYEALLWGLETAESLK